MIRVLHALVGVGKLVIFVAAVPALSRLQPSSIAMSQWLLILCGRRHGILEVKTTLVHCFRQELMKEQLSLFVLLMRGSVPLPDEL